MVLLLIKDVGEEEGVGTVTTAERRTKRGVVQEI
jgi:hypothetical protein